jgi:hypothetical protein
MTQASLVSMATFYFVEGHLPHGSRDSSSVSAIRSHVRRANLERASLASDFRSLTITDFVMGRTRGRRRWRPANIQGALADESAGTKSPSSDACRRMSASPTTAFDYSIASQPTMSSVQWMPISGSCPNWLAASSGQLDLWHQQIQECLYSSQSPVHLAVGANWVGELIASCES